MLSKSVMTKSHIKSTANARNMSNESCSELNTLIKSLSSETDAAVLVDCLKHFRDNIYLIDKENHKAITAILGLNWTEMNKEISAVFEDLMLNLVTAHTDCLQAVLIMIIKIFTKVQADCEYVTKEENECFEKGHKLLRRIFGLFPTSPELVCGLLCKQLPYLRRPPHVILCFVVNMLNICTYLPSYRMDILGIIMDYFLTIDSHCTRETILLWEQGREEKAMNTMETDTLTDGLDVMAYPLANTLDMIMLSLFKFIECTCYSGGTKVLNWDATKKLYRELLTLFDKYILLTRCCHVQFVMFYVCSLKPSLCDGFLDYLWKKVNNPNSPPNMRQVAAFYIGSLLSRASYISISTLSACLTLICNWLHSYINNNDSQNYSDTSAHGTFHCVCQIIFYVIAFRHNELINMNKGFKFLRRLNLERIVMCRLNPLKFCQPNIVQNFASFARNYQIAYCYPVIERNCRSLNLRDYHSDNYAAMNTFFPFDPYELKRSKRYIASIYRVYKANEELMSKEDEDSFIEQQSAVNSALTLSTSPGFKEHVFVHR